MIRRFRADRSGSAIMQFALVAAPFVGLLIAILSTALAFFVQEAIETAAEAAARSIMTGQAQTTGSNGGAQTADQFKAAACAKLPSFLDCTKLLVDVRVVNNFSDANTTAPTITYDANGNVSNTFNYDLGARYSIVVLHLMYLWPVPTGPLGSDLSNAGPGVHLLQAVSVARNEPYQTSGS